MNAKQPARVQFEPEEWTIYNCHIHTFTKKHSPRQFWQWLMSDAELGRISGRRVPVYVSIAVGYFILMKGLADKTIELSKRSDTVSRLLYSLATFLQALLVFPAALLATVLLAVAVILLLQSLINRLRGRSPGASEDMMMVGLAELKKKVDQGQKRLVRFGPLFELLVWINPNSNDIFERIARFIKTSEQPTQKEVFHGIQKQYPEGTVFVVLPMDMTFMEMGPPGASIDQQHAELLCLAHQYPKQVIPFYAADPRQCDIVNHVRKHVKREKDRFRGIKIYPNLGYAPDHKNLLKIYKYCIEQNLPVITHCSPGGIWRYGLSRQQRRDFSKPERYRNILDNPEYRDLKLCLAHFGGADEWIRHLKGRTYRSDDEPWVRTIFEMLSQPDRYPNLYADISYTVFTPKVTGLYIDLVDYLKVMLTHEHVRERVLFGSDYYMVERESVSEKEASILLRSRLGENLYKQIAHTNPKRFLGIE